MEKNKKKIKKVWINKRRSALVQNIDIDSTVLVHNGRSYKKLVVLPEMVGYKYGVFSFTRKFCNHNRKKMKSRKKK